MLPIIIAALATGGALAYYAWRNTAGDNDGSPEKGIQLAKAASAYLGWPYQWGGGHSPGTWGLDCSGLVILALKDIGGRFPRGIVPTSNGLYHGLPIVTGVPRVGDLIFYGPNPGKAIHVAILDHDGTVLSSNGDQTYLTREIAKAKGGGVRRMKDAYFRKDILGYRRLV